MKPRWEALGARSRGLRTHLLTDERLGRVGRATSMADLTHELRETPYGRFLPPPREVAARAVELAIVRSLADRMATLARWDGPDGKALAVVYLEQDMRNVRHVLRGAVGALGSEQRLAGCIPTPTLDRKALELLARAESPGAIAATLVAWDHPLGSAILEASEKAHPDLFRLETALARHLASEASDAAKRAGRHVRHYVSESLDDHNVVTALVLAGARSESAPGELFVEGGSALDAEGFAAAAAADGPLSAAEILAAATRGTLFEAPLGEPSASPSRVSTRIVAARIRRLAREERLEPVSAAPVLLFILRLRDEARRVREALWGVALAGAST